MLSDRHLASNKYLRVDPGTIPFGQNTQGGPRIKTAVDVTGGWHNQLHAATLVDNETVAGVKGNELDFVLHMTEKASFGSIGTSGSAINIEHVLSETESCWLGNTHWAKGKEEGLGLGGTLVSEGSFQIAFSTVRGEEDALRILAAPADEQVDMETARNILRCASAYRKRISRGTTKISDKHTAEAEAMLAASINFTTVMHRESSAEGEDGSPVSGLSSLSGGGGDGIMGEGAMQGEALLQAKGPPRKSQQALCADMKVGNPTQQLARN